MHILRDMWEGQFACQHWKNDEDVMANTDFFVCAREKLREALGGGNFNCTNVWLEKYFPEGLRECNYDQDFDQIIELG